MFRCMDLWDILPLILSTSTTTTNDDDQLMVESGKRFFRCVDTAALDEDLSFWIRRYTDVSMSKAFARVKQSIYCLNNHAMEFSTDIKLSLIASASS